MKQLLQNWDKARIIRLLAGIGFGLYALLAKEYFLLLFAALLILQAMLNRTCCGTACSSDSNFGKQEEVYKGQIKQYKGKDVSI